MSETEAFDDVGLGWAAGDADVFVAVGGEDVVSPVPVWSGVRNESHVR